MTRVRLDPDADFQQVFQTIARRSWRWECQGHYASDEQELNDWLTGRTHEDDGSDRAWYDYIRGLRQRGIPFERVRMLTEPLTDYLRWMLTNTHLNVEAGEDIRWLSQTKARDFGMPNYDFYLFDDNRVLILNFDEQKVLTGEELIDDPDTVERHRRWRDLVWHHAVRHEDYRPAR